jgi:chromosome segregation ATPase
MLVGTNTHGLLLSLRRGYFGRVGRSDREDMGLNEGLRHSLERYLERSAAELDDRGAELNFRAHEITAELEQLEAVEADIRERERRVAELRPVQERLDEALRRALVALEERTLQLAGKAGELRERTTNIVETEAELSERERLAAYRRDRLRSEQKLLAERERELAEAEGSYASAETLAQQTRWLEHREKRVADTEQLAQDRLEELGRREKDLEAREVRVGVDLQVRQEELERQERELGELEQRLARKERELQAYVAQLQGGLPIRPTLVEPPRGPDRNTFQPRSL